MRVLAIERVERPSLEVFRHRYERPGRPVVITSAIDDWPSLDRWSFDHLARMHGDRMVSVRVTDPEHQARPGADMHGAFRRLQLPLAKFLARSAEAQGGARYYLQHCDLPRELPRLAAEIAQPRYCPRWLLSSPLLWVGGAGAITPLHYDYDSVLMAGVVGEKHYRLVARRDSAKISGLVQRTMWRTALFDPRDNHQSARHPHEHFRDVEVHECILQPGELLFIPYRWWHHMESSTPSISVSWWWEPNLLLRARDTLLSRALQPFRTLARALRQ